MKGWKRSVAWAAPGIAWLAFAAAGRAAEEERFFEESVRPLLETHCLECHSEKAGKRKGGLWLDRRAGWAEGGDSGPALIPGDVESSLLLRAVRHVAGDLEMPPDGRLSGPEVAVLERRVAMGAPDPRTGEAAATAPGIDLEAGRRFWAFQPVRKPPVPEAKDRAWALTPIDRFIRARQEEVGVEPVAEAEAAVLLRRLTFDLTGLPPTPEEIDRFLAASADRRLEELADRLMGGPRFGETWGRHWLDVARYADSTGGGRTTELPQAWRYRNYVLEAFDEDRPFAEFVREQIAGDLLERADPEGRNRALVATGFLALGPKNLDLQDKEQLLMNTVDEQIDTVGQVFLAMTLGCARCHDHKFDPIPTADYYALAGIFRSTQTLVRANISMLVETPLEGWDDRRAAHQEHAERMKALDQAIRDEEARVGPAGTGAGPGGELERLRAAREEAKRDVPPPVPAALTVREAEIPADCRICIRGEVHRLGEPVPRGFLQVALPEGAPSYLRIGPEESGRRQLAEWLCDPRNPLVARVYVNRVWQQLLGRGLVATSDNFGSRGEPPSDPLLLDWLAARFLEEGGSTKWLVREIVRSRVYRLGGGDDAENRSIDPVNRWWWRSPGRRLRAEELRDALLAVSGQLDLARGEGLPPLSALEESHLRTVYLPVFREEGSHPLLDAFDFPDPSTSTARRGETNLPTQSLFLMNAPFVLQAARWAAERQLAAGANRPTEDLLVEAWRRALGRAPAPVETERTLAFLAGTSEDGAAARHGPAASVPLETWTGVWHALFASVDFRYLNRPVPCDP